MPRQARLDSPGTLRHVDIVRGLVENYGVAIAEVARQVGISTSGASKIMTRTLSS